MFPLAVGVIISTPAVRAADWPQYNGLIGDKHSAEKIAMNWPAEGPRPIWKAPLTAGFSSLTVAGGRAFTIVKRNVDGVENEVVVALDAASGKEQWTAALGVAKYDGGGDTGTPDNKGGDGPRSTPSADGNRVYAYSSRLVLVCLDAADGKRVWACDVSKEHGGKNITWQSAASPLVAGNLVFVVGGGPGESLLAFDKESGQVAWKGEDDGITHSTPTAATIHGVPQVIFYTQKGLVSVAPLTGKILWRQAYPKSTSSAISPVVSGDVVYVSSGYGTGAGVYQVAKDGDHWTTKEAWRNRQIQSHWSTPLCQDGYLYGIFGQVDPGKNPLKCIELATGKEMWSKAGFGPGGLIFADGHLVVLADNGDLVAVEANSKEYREVARAKVLEGKCWSTPTLSNGHLYVRSTKEGACLDLSPEMAAR